MRVARILWCAAIFGAALLIALAIYLDRRR